MAHLCEMYRRAVPPDPPLTSATVPGSTEHPA